MFTKNMRKTNVERPQAQRGLKLAIIGFLLVTGNTFDFRVALAVLGLAARRTGRRKLGERCFAGIAALGCEAAGAGAGQAVWMVHTAPVPVLNTSCVPSSIRGK